MIYFFLLHCTVSSAREFGESLAARDTETARGPRGLASSNRARCIVRTLVRPFAKLVEMSPCKPTYTRRRSSQCLRLHKRKVGVFHRDLPPCERTRRAAQRCIARARARARARIYLRVFCHFPSFFVSAAGHGPPIGDWSIG